MVNEYAKYSDEELIVQLRDGDHAITITLWKSIRIWCAARHSRCTFWVRTGKI